MAAGRGTRFASDTAKVLHLVGDKPMVTHVVASGQAAGLDPIVVVIRPDLDMGSAALGASTVEQPPGDRGTAYATEVGLRAVPPSVATVCVLYGDAPLVRPSTIGGVVMALRAARAVAAVAWADVPDPGALGRVVLDDAGLVEGVVEAADATSAQLTVTTVNAGPAAFRADWLRQMLSLVEPSAASGERYLTSLFQLATAGGARVAGYEIADLDETIGCDDPERLAAANAAFHRRNASGTK